MTTTTLMALGIVFGDIGTSPLYAMQTVLQDEGQTITPPEIMGVLSLVLWTILLVVAFKYALLVMRADNNGEGGVLALTAVVTGARQADDARRIPAYRRLFSSSLQRGLLAAGLFGGALLFGDSILTPSISVLSAMEGMQVADPALRHVVLPCALGVLVALFVAQRAGTSLIGNLFGPVMLVWFVTIGVLGLIACLRHPGVLAAIDPAYAIDFLHRNGRHSLLLLGGVFLTVTGAEALYADMGSVGRGSVRLAWFAIVLPALVLCYAGQASALMDAHTLPANPFYAIVPKAGGTVAIWAIVALATCATIIASQAVITGVFSITRQAVQLGWFPGMRILQTSAKEYGQIYVPTLNWIIMVLTVALTAFFGSSSRLAGAYGMAVSATMLLTTLLFGAYLKRRRHWPVVAVVTLVACFLVVDVAFLSANLLKLTQGGYLPLLAGITVYGIMSIWRRGQEALHDAGNTAAVTPDALRAQLAKANIPRTPGNLVFLSSLDKPIPPNIALHVRQFGALPERVMTLSVIFDRTTPRVPISERIDHRIFEDMLVHVTVRYGFMEAPALLPALQLAAEDGAPISPDEAIFIAEHDEVARNANSATYSLLRRWERPVFAFLYRNANRAVDSFELPPERLVQIGRRIAL
ncbi:potassium transporter Kup [Gluconacetobacter diazotrophicus]|nr:KUP/HAK/KT family potassium transporter [Gluconacetobacter diazotrophicus]MBB2155133.1 KUP/HAK/KT family potassium transporter [Gluconacetobacter diazotrophicus]